MLPRSQQFTLLLISLLCTSSAFNTGISLHNTNRLLQQRRTNHHTQVITAVLPSSLSNNEGDDPVDELNDDAVISSNSSPSEPPSVASPTATSTRQLDPLFLAVTQMDPQTQRAERISVPIWGELILDRSLFVFLPIALFAFGGFFLSFYVLVNSGDTFVNAIIDTAMKQSIPTSSSSLPDTDSCRGLCSSQAQDLEGLRSYMNRLGGK